MAAIANTARVTIYGIPNCDQVKKALIWLEARQVSYAFHDFKKQGLSREIATSWLDQAGAEVLINRKGSTWRALDEARKALVDKASGAVALMLENPSIVKRPVLDIDGAITTGFNADHYNRLFQ